MIDITNVKRTSKKITAPKLVFEQNESHFICCACGKKYTKQIGNFAKSQSPLYAGNSGFLPICNHCLEALYEQYIEQLGNHPEALKRVCMHWDIYYTDKLAASCYSVSGNTTRMIKHLKTCNLGQYNGKTFDSYLLEVANIISDDSDVSKYDSEHVTTDIVTIWGLGYTEAEYKMLNDHYNILKEQIDSNDPIQDALIKDACEQHILKYRYRDNDIDKYDKVSKLYQNTLSNANLKPRAVNKDQLNNNPDECWGNFIKTVETISPADYFKDKKIFEDFDKMDEYYKRFIKRPTDNLINGTSVMDEEFSIKADDDGQ